MDVVVDSPKYGILIFKIDEEDNNLFASHSWYARKYSKYIYLIGSGREIRGKPFHRMIMKANKEEIVDHINGDTLDNRKQNLRICSIKENNRNRKMPITNTSGYKGVSFDIYHYNHGAKKCWVAQITCNDKRIKIGRFMTREEAALAYNEAATKYFGDFARINIMK